VDDLRSFPLIKKTSKSSDPALWQMWRGEPVAATLFASISQLR
jgi:hypothetical protein